MAHNNFLILQKLILLLDDKENDIYVHIDKKVKDFDFDKFRNLTKYSRVYFVKRINVQWGAYSQIKCEYGLFEAAYKNNYRFYHLLSGTDLPITSNAIINSFFRDSTYKGFIFHDYHTKNNKSYLDRIKYYYFFQQILGRETSILFYPLYRMNDLFLSLQKKLHINRLKKRKLNITKASQWISIDNDLMSLILSQKKTVHKLFKFSLCSDELFVPTIIDNSEFRDCICEDYKRLIDWKRGGPYTFTSEDYNEIVTSNNFFVRKLDEKKDFKIVEKIYDYVNNL